MKKIFFLILLATGFAVTSCTDSLNPKPLGSQAITSVDLYKTPDDFLQGLAKVYAGFNLQGSNGDTDITTALTGGDGGATVYSRQYWKWQELSTDEAVIAWTNNGDLLNIHLQNWVPNTPFGTALYTRIMFTITLANEFIRQSNGNSDATIQKYNAEARFLRALAYYHALDFFRKPPFITEADPIGAAVPKQTTAADLFAYIESELTAIEPLLGPPKFDYGHADKGALWMLQAKLFINANVYIGTDRNADASTALLHVINDGGYALASNYLMNFRADNNTSPEMIYAWTQDGVHSQTYGGMTFVIHAATGGNMDPAVMGIASGWGGTRATKNLVNLFPDPSGATDIRAQFFTNGQNLEIKDYTIFSDGYAVQKFKNKNFDGSPASSGAPDFVDADFPVFRLADAYLMYAEVLLRSSGSLSDALKYVNLVRERAFGNDSGNITQNQLTLDFIIDERGRELYWEGHRRTDLVRFGLLTQGDNANPRALWPWKGNTPDGTLTDVHYNVLPIPASDIAVNPNLKQNEGYVE